MAETLEGHRGSCRKFYAEDVCTCGYETDVEALGAAVLRGLGEMPEGYTGIAGVLDPWTAHADLLKRIETLEANEKDWSDQARRYCEQIETLTREREWNFQRAEKLLNRLIGEEAQVETLTRERDDYEKAASGLSADLSRFGADLQAAEAKLAEAEKALERIEGVAGEDIADVDLYEAITDITRAARARIQDM